MSSQESQIKSRLRSIDILRGLIILLMALDHTRDFFGPTAFDPTDLSQSDPAWFFTRWITHFCAPLFIFLSGISAYLYSVKVNSLAQTRHFLFSRGLWLIFVEIFIVNVSWQFAFNFLFLQVIWAIGWSMLILGLLSYFSTRTIFIISILTLLLHNSVDGPKIYQAFGDYQWLWAFLHYSAWLKFGASEFPVFVAYPIIPWFAVMALGFSMGELFKANRQLRKKVLVVAGASSCVLFLLLRLVIDYGDPYSLPENFVQRSWLEILNTTKYPPSLQYLCMTLGPGFILLALLESKRINPDFTVIKWIEFFGKVPMFFYLIHVPVIHLGGLIYTQLVYGQATNLVIETSKWPTGYQANLALVFLAWAVIILMLYFPCKHYAEFKTRNKNPWLSYL